MASRKLVRDLFRSKHPLFRQLLEAEQVSSGYTRLCLVLPKGYSFRREFSVFNEFSKKIKGEVFRNQEFKQSVTELQEKAEELKSVKEDLKVRTKQTSEKLYKHVDGLWMEAEEKAKKVYADVEEKISAAKVEVKETFGIGKQESQERDGTLADHNSSDKDGSNSGFREEKRQGQKQQSESSNTAETIFGKVKSGVSSFSPKVSLAFLKLKEAKPIDLVKKGYDIVKDELKGNPNRRKRLEYDASSASSSPRGERSTRTDVVVLPSTQSAWSKKWEAFKEKMQGHPIFKRVSGISEPVIGKSQEIAEDMRERWETSDHPVVHKIQDISETVLGESNAAMSFKEIRRRDPTFSLPEFVAEVQEVIKPVLNAYFKGDVEVLSKYCSSEVIERCKAEHKAFEKGGQDTIHTVYYAWAMQQLDPEELGDGAPYSIWRLREMQQLGVRALV
ncbi:mitochondrial import inner membrane translocase subunit TIM44-2-like [Olea europaea subsp. europaea]|uniref:Mitochondrial import inner membrane translocase subunit TIM44-2-like n=1 Tax=Olea europaea subsp. europaea TaxID=158383 RepID=A0A8S0UME0_OLEEU|nr:mitochondrial import inner membrane translocase subunit TIM44-2-like [Olea europaea subsp. europaea]